MRSNMCVQDIIAQNLSCYLHFRLHLFHLHQTSNMNEPLLFSSFNPSLIRRTERRYHSFSIDLPHLIQWKLSQLPISSQRCNFLCCSVKLHAIQKLGQFFICSMYLLIKLDLFHSHYLWERFPAYVKLVTNLLEMEENTTSLPSSENTFTVFDYNMNNHTNSAVAMGKTLHTVSRYFSCNV